MPTNRFAARSLFTAPHHSHVAAFLLTAVFGVCRCAAADEVSGHVIGPGDRPVNGTTVAILFGLPGTSYSRVLEIETGADGAFHATIPANAFARACVYVPGFALSNRMLAPGADAKFQLQRGQGAAGRIVDSRGKPVSKARVCLLGVSMPEVPGTVLSYLYYPATADRRILATTDAAGRFTFDSVPAGALIMHVAIEDPRFVEERADVDVSHGSSGTGVSHLEALVARPAATLSGRVVDSTGAPVPGLDVSLSGEGNGISADATTDSRGRYHVGGLPSGAFAIGLRDHRSQNSPNDGTATEMPAVVTMPLRQILAKEGADAAVPDIIASPGGLIVGQFTDAVSGSPLSVPIAVEARAADGPGYGETALVDSKGKYTVRVPAGAMTIGPEALPTGYIGKASDGYEAGRQTVTVAEGQTVTVDFPLEPGLTLSGMAVDDAGKPVPRVHISAAGQGQMPDATTDDSGRWTIAGLHPGTVRIVGLDDFEVVEGAEEKMPNETALPTIAPLILHVRPFKALPVVGRVVTTDGKPASGIEVSVITRLSLGGRRTTSRFDRYQTDTQGTYTLPSLRPEDPDVRLIFASKSFKVVKPGVLKREADAFVLTDTVVQSLEATGKLSGRVIDASGRAVAYALIETPLSTGIAARTRSDASGHFALTAVARDEQEVLAAYGSDFSSVPATGDITLRLSPAKTDLPGHSVDRAKVLLDAILAGAMPAEDSHIDDVGALDPDLALAYLKRDSATGHYNDWQLSRLIESVASDAPARANAFGRPLLSQITNPGAHRIAAYALAVAAPVPDRGQLDDALAEFHLPAVQTAGAWGVDTEARSAVIAWRLGEPDIANAHLEKALALVHGLNGTAPGSTYIPVSLAVTLAHTDPGLSRKAIAAVPAKDREPAFAEVIRAVARYSASGAMELLADMRRDATGPIESDAQFAQSQLIVVNALAQSDPASAIKVARAVRYPSFETTALAIAAHAQTDAARAERLYRQASGEVAGNPDQMSHIAALAVDTKPALGRELFAAARQSLETLRGSNPAAYNNLVVGFACYYARVAPGESRLLLEAAAEREEIATRDTSGSENGTLSDLAMAMCPLDADRAIAISRLIPSPATSSEYDMRVDVQLRIARYLLASPEERKTMPMLKIDRFGWSAAVAWP